MNPTLSTSTLQSQKEEPKIFWMLYAEGGSAPSAKHMTVEEMEKECERIARQSGKKVYILKTVGFMEIEKPLPPPVKFTKYE